MKIVVGSTGFVGSNLMASGKYDRGFHRTDITEAYGLQPQLCVYAGVRAEKFLADADPEKDLDAMREALLNIERIAPKRLVLVSTIDVFGHPAGVDETSVPEKEEAAAYGKNRLFLETEVRKRYPDAYVIRLPGLYGKNLKKNFLYDCINRIPSMLTKKKLDALAETVPEIRTFYEPGERGFYKVRPLDDAEKQALRKGLSQCGFDARFFTDSRSRFQFYPLSRLAEDIEVCLKEDIHLFHPATPPLSAAEIYGHVYGEDFVNETAANPAFYDYRTCHAALFGGRDGYITDRESLLADLAAFIGGNKT